MACRFPRVSELENRAVALLLADHYPMVLDIWSLKKISCSNWFDGFRPLALSVAIFSIVFPTKTLQSKESENE
jgi:hypothetical protein